jgi:adenine-specific DNA glycosylase
LTENGSRNFPTDFNAALALPGVGSYTAAAVLSIAHGQRYAAVDGNIARVLSRLGRVAKADDVRALADDLLDRKRPGDWNQALMELGQTVCLPHAPICSECPLNAHCRASARGDARRFPMPAKRRAAEHFDLKLTIVRDPDGRLLLQRGVFPHLPHLWLPPIEIRAARQNPRTGRPRTFQHTILHRVFRVEVASRVLSPDALEKRARRAIRGGEVALFSPPDLARIGRSALLTKALRHAAESK